MTRLGMAQVVALLLAILAGMVLSAEAPRPCCNVDKDGYRVCCGYDERFQGYACCVYTPRGEQCYGEGHGISRPPVCDDEC